MERTVAHSLRLVYLVAVIGVGGAAIAASIVELAAAPPRVDWYVLLILTVVSGSAVLRFPGFAASFSISDVFTFLAALLFGPAAGTVMVAVDGLAITRRLARRGTAIRRLLFNATAPAAAMWVSSQLFFRLADTGPLVTQPSAITHLFGPLVVFASMYFLVNTGLIAVAIALDEDRSVLAIWREHFLGLWASFFGGAWVAALVIVLGYDRRGGLAVIFLLLPLPLLLYFAFATALARMRERLEDLERAHRIYQSLVHGAAYGIARVSVDGRFVHANPALARMLGYESVVPLLAANLWNNIWVDPKERESLLAVSGSELTRTIEDWWRRRDGSKVMVRASVRVTAENEIDAAGFEMLVEDVSDRRDLEQRLRQAEKLDALGRMARGIVHDFNNLMMVITGMGELARDGLPKDHPSRMEIGELLGAATTATTLTGQLLAFTRQQPVQPVELDLNHVITETLSMLKRLAGPQVIMECALAPDLPRIHADRSQLQQVIMNLVVNARDAMPEGGRVTISTMTGDANGKRRVVLEVADTGTGMTDEIRAHVFEPYFTTKKAGKGTGLGLATVYGIVSQNNGDVRVSSTVGVGTTFTIELPARAPQSASK